MAPIKIKSAIASVGGEGGRGFRGSSGGISSHTSTVYNGEIDEVKSGAGGKGGQYLGCFLKGGLGCGGGTLQIGTKGYLLAENRPSGRNWNLSDFAKKYGLSLDLKAKLEREGYLDADAIRWLTIDDTEDMRLMKGEIASLKGALDTWSPK